MSKMYSFRLHDEDAEAFDAKCDEIGVVASKVFQEAALRLIGKTPDDAESVGLPAKRGRKPGTAVVLAGRLIGQEKGASKHAVLPAPSAKERSIVGFDAVTGEALYR